MLVLRLSRLTVAPTIAAWLESRTFPWILPRYSCPRTVRDSSTGKTANTAIDKSLLNIIVIKSSPLLAGHGEENYRMDNHILAGVYIQNPILHKRQKIASKSVQLKVRVTRPAPARLENTLPYL